MEMGVLDREFGMDAGSDIEALHQRSFEGAIAALKMFYYSFNNRDMAAMNESWYDSTFIRLNNPVGGIIRGINPVMEIYDRIFNGQAKVWVKLMDITYYQAEEMVVFTGTEVGEFATSAEVISLKIRTTRIFGYIDSYKRWFQLHHHGSIDNPRLLDSYQRAVQK